MARGQNRCAGETLTAARILRLEQQQQQQQILSMEMVENATFRTIISKLINVVLALLAVVLVFVSTAATFLSPFVHSTSRLLLSGTAALVAWLLYHNLSYIESAASSLHSFFTWPWS
ncbi:transmembrane and coiled-coil domains protein 2 [Aplysia californica]|uniref:Transmembrane and coiled-coil domains protein 2 n=1 Tax=Aplysia californica TaxID=6500 RepID=A0ABM1AC09_APLCA|nr:transmembrane and coiled-coil domains protein 2 [Aplysia californica]